MQVSLKIASTLAILMLASPILAQDRLQPDFTFKRVSVPEPGSTNLITIQIEPKEVKAPAAQPEEPIADRLTSDTMKWFWDDVSPALADTGPGRAELAVSALRNAPHGERVAAPRLKLLQQLASAYGADILRNTVGTDVSPPLVLALIAVESGGRAKAESSAGALGVMQLMPDTAARFGVEDRENPSENIKGGIAYLAWLMEHFDKDPILALAGYNAGEGAVRDNAGVPPFAETRAYVPKVLAAWTVARALCQTPPELITDGCVFKTSN